MSSPLRSLHTPVEAGRKSNPMLFAGTRMPEDIERSPARVLTGRTHGSVSDALQAMSSIDATEKRTEDDCVHHLGYAFRNTIHAQGTSSAVEHSCVAASSRGLPTVSRLNLEFSKTDHIGNGNFGSVTRGIHDLDGCKYAIKKSNKPLLGEADLQHRLQEVYALSGCSGKGGSPYILRYFDAWIEAEGFVCIRTEYLDEGNLRKLCVKEGSSSHSGARDLRNNPFITPDSEGHVDPCRVWEFLFQMSMGLNSIHTTHTMAHLDVKPDNIFVSIRSHTMTRKNPPKVPPQKEAHDSVSGGGDVFEYVSVAYRLGDFGLARPAGSDNHGEQYKGLNDDEGDKRYLCPYLLSSLHPNMLREADVYSLGASTLEVIGCEPVSVSDSDEKVIDRVLQVLPPSNLLQRVAEGGEDELSTSVYPTHLELAHLIASMVRRDPVARPSTLTIATASFREMQKYRRVRGIDVLADEPPEVTEVEELRRMIAEIEQEIEHLEVS